MAIEIYGTLAASRTYHSDRGNAAWASVSDEDANAALGRASEYIDGHFEPQFDGERTGGRDQERAWPRTSAEDIYGDEFPDDEVPLCVQHATYEAALREAATRGYFSPDYIASGQVKMEAVDGAVSTEYFPGSGSASDVQPEVPILYRLLRPVLVVNAFSSLSGRAVRG